jgi:class 3 adenylate cyclase
MLIDMNGFTKLSAKYCNEDNTNGLDELHQMVSGYLGTLVTTVYSFGGDVVSFAGDALLCVFTDYKLVQDDPSYIRGIKCASELVKFPMNNLTAHIGMSYGDMALAIVGGYQDK